MLHISPELTRTFSRVLFPVWKRLQMEQKRRVTGNDFSGRNLVSAREGHRVNPFFQVVCREEIYEEEKNKERKRKIKWQRSSWRREKISSFHLLSDIKQQLKAAVMTRKRKAASREE